MSDPFDPSGQGQKPPESAKWEKDKAEKPEWKEDKDESKSETKDLIGPEMIIEPPIGASVPSSSAWRRRPPPPSAGRCSGTRRRWRRRRGPSGTSSRSPSGRTSSAAR